MNLKKWWQSMAIGVLREGARFKWSHGAPGNEALVQQVVGAASAFSNLCVFLFFACSLSKNEG
jgi:hypothetical protein